MINKKVGIGILTIMLILGTVIVGNIDAQPDNQLNGTWVYTADNMTDEIIFLNGNFEQSTIENNTLAFGKGTYTASNGILHLQTTHIMHIGVDEFIEIGIESEKWHKIDDFAEYFRRFMIDNGIPAKDADEVFLYFVTPQKSTYSISSNSLSITTNYYG